MSTEYLVPVYITYLVVAVGLVVWLARTLFSSGAVFLDDVFPDTPGLSKAVNRLLVVGFYMLNLGFALLMMKATSAATPFEAMEVFAAKMGMLLLSLGAIHFGNLYLFHRMRRRSRLRFMPPPVAPQAVIGGVQTHAG